MMVPARAGRTRDGYRLLNETQLSGFKSLTLGSWQSFVAFVDFIRTS